jgi:hypothetical protein
MKLAEYLEKIEQIDPCDIEAFVNMSYEVVGNKHNLHFDSRDVLTKLLAEKVQEAGRILRAEECYPHSPTSTPSQEDA